MKTFLKSSASLLVLASFSVPALGADVYNGGSTKDAPSQYHEGGSVVNWTGFYFQGQVGYGISQHDLTTTTITDFPAVSSKCWARGSWTSTNSPTTDPQNLQTLSNDFDLNIFDDNGDTDVDVQLPAYGQSDVDPDPRVHQVNAGASVTDVTSEECEDIRREIGLIDANGDDKFETITSGYDPAVEAHTVTETFKGKTSDSGLEGGVRLGADYAMGRFLVGAFGEYNWSGIDGKENDWALGGRLGLIVAPRTLIYGLAAYTQAEYDFGGADTVTFDGWKLGAGVELALTGNVFLGAEYTHAMYDEETVFSGGSVTVEDELTEDKIMANIKIKLNGGF